MTLQKTYKRIEQILILFMIIGIIAMFQPWFRTFVEWLQPFVTASEEANFGRTYKDDWAPFILRLGFFSTFIATIAYTALTHYSVEDLERAFEEKGKALTFLLISLPIISGIAVLYSLAFGHYWAAVVNVFAFVFALGFWNWRRRGFIGLGVAAVIVFALALTGSAYMPLAILLLLVAFASIALGVPKWPRFT